MADTYEGTPTSAGSNGYTCNKCGMWVWNNQNHNCGYAYFYPRDTYYWTDRSQEIIDLLKEIKELLIRIVPQVDKEAK